MVFPPQAVDFPNDICLPPYIDEKLESFIESSNGRVDAGLRLETIFVEPTADGQDA